MKSKSEKVVTRFAPSPTGSFHIGGLRTALVNYCFASKHGGTFHLRIENTDVERSRLPYEAEIKLMLKEFGIAYHPEVIVQMEKKQLRKYPKIIDSLVNGRELAYYAFDTKEELEQMKKDQIKRGVNQTYYDREKGINSLTLSEEDFLRKVATEDFVIRLNTSSAPDEFILEDEIKGRVRFGKEVLDDFILMKTGCVPTYHFANVVDDLELGVTHVIRGEEWLSSVPKHLFLYEILSPGHRPKFAHLPLILNEDGTKMSKRDRNKNGSFSVFAKDHLKSKQALLEYLLNIGITYPDKEKGKELKYYVENMELKNFKKKSIAFNYATYRSFQEFYFHKALEISLDTLQMSSEVDSRHFANLLERLKVLPYFVKTKISKQILVEIKKRAKSLTDLEKLEPDTNSLKTYLDRDSYKAFLEALQKVGWTVNKYQSYLNAMLDNLHRSQCEESVFFTYLTRYFEDADLKTFMNLTRSFIFEKEPTIPFWLIPFLTTHNRSWYHNLLEIRAKSLGNHHCSETLSTDMEKEVFSLFFE